METNAVLPAAPAVAIEKGKVPRKPPRHWLEENPPPPVKAYTVEQTETLHPGLKGRLRTWIKPLTPATLSFTG